MIVLSTLLTLVASLTIKYEISDGTKRNSYIGNVPQDAGVAVSDYAEEGYYSIVMGNSYLQVNPSSGDLRTSSDIDREEICSKFVDSCIVNVEVIITPRELFQLFKIELTILDLNDNAPKFPVSSIELNIAEDAQVGTLIRLDSATDADSARFNIAKYELKELGDTWEKYFELEQEVIDQAIIPKLKLVTELDYEQKKEHTLELTARDKGNAPFSGTMKIKVNVIDVNDESPHFPQARFTLNVSELTKTGDVILNLNATDGDSGTNGRLSYGYSSLVDEKTRTIFPIDSDSGIISVGERSIDFEDAKKYVLYVEVRDNALNPRWAYCTVVVNIIDANDNTPQVEVSFVGSDSPHQSLSEDVKIGSFVAFVSVTDDDLGESGRVTTVLDENDDFELETVDVATNRFILKTKSALDRERRGLYDLIVRARDHGVPPLESIKVVHLKVADINDNPPVFPHSEYHVVLKENNLAGVKVTTIKANDPDEGKNARIRYSLVNNRHLFKIDEQTGELFARVALDAEQYRQNIVLHIKATDGGQPTLSGYTSIRITVKDENDNRPVFAMEKYSFNLAENQPVGTVVGQVSATDRDADSAVRYGIKERSIYFGIDEETGHIVTKRELDHETDPTFFNLTLIACDNGEKCDLSRLVISISDINDNEPEIIWPGSQQEIIPVLRNESSTSSIVAAIRTRDLDSGESGRVTCTLQGKSRVFLLSPDCRVSLLRDLTSSDDGLISIRIKASDNGFPSIFTTMQLNFAISARRLNETELAQLVPTIQVIEPQRLASSPNNFLVIVIGSTIGLVLIVALFAGVICSR